MIFIRISIRQALKPACESNSSVGFVITTPKYVSWLGSAAVEPANRQHSCSSVDCGPADVLRNHNRWSLRG